MRFRALWTLLVFRIICVYGVFVDEAYRSDYHQALLGIPRSDNTFFSRPTASTNASLLYTLSDKDVLGAVNPKDGSLVWRQPLSSQFALSQIAGGASQSTYAKQQRTARENSGIPSGILKDEGGSIVWAYHGSTVLAFDAAGGKLLWRKFLPTHEHIIGAQLVLSANSVRENNLADLVVLYQNEGTVLARLDGSTGSIMWEVVDSSITSPRSLVSDGSHIHYTSVQSSVIGSSSLKMSTVAADDGRALNPETLKASLLHQTLSCPGAAYILWSDPASGLVKVSPLGSSKTFTFILDNHNDIQPEEIEILPSCGPNSSLYALLHARTGTGSWAEIISLPSPDAEISRSAIVPLEKTNAAFAVSIADGQTFFTRVTDVEIELYTTTSNDVAFRWPRQQKSFGGPAHVRAELVLRGGSSYAVRVAEVSQGGEWSLMRNDELIWSRSEMLSKVVAAAWADDISGEALAHELASEGHENPFRAYLHRVKRHMVDLRYLPNWLQQLPSSIASGLLTSKNEAEKGLLGNKLLIVATSSGEYLALNPLKAGEIKWKRKAERVFTEEEQAISLYIQDNIVTSYVSGVGVLTMNATDGSTISFEESDARFTQVVIMPGTVAPVSYRLLRNGEPQTTSQDDIAQDGSYLVSYPDDGSEIQGWMTGKSQHKLWTFSHGHGYTVVNVVSRPRHDPVSSIAKVLADRSVLYKYLSRNLILVTSVNQSSSTVAIDLLDSITGTVLYSVTHHQVATYLQIPSVLSENWFAYSFYSTASRSRHDSSIEADSGSGSDNIASSQSQAPEIFVTELYESPIPNDRGPLGSAANYSSFPSAYFSSSSSASSSSTTTSIQPNRPHVITQSFVLAHPITHLATTQTLQGITSRQLLAIIPSLGALVSIPRSGSGPAALDPRRPQDRDPTPQEASEEGLLSRYSPVLDLSPALHYLTHARSVLGLQKIITSPTQLESTSLIFAFGHDIFGTRIQPSKAFDVLGKDFNKLALVGTVVALALLTTFLAPMVRKKGVDRWWKA